ncbi:arf-GAP with Rho-GAP domain, ANK repeat and PH domain-containing protein 1-like isoform X2 [Babylonia areolata]|uniref:arf-GAP with Rho-GAP domain, ANK repeat and PH domain-containing protein 1-like isoform X2 n=1 Tax=Babylonia areolata TaxID=304850 RepID=UPI003FD2B613
MDEDGVYDVPRSFQTPATPATQATPPSLPPKKSTKPASLKDLDGLSSSCPESRPKPMPRRTVRSSSSLSDRAVTSPTTPTQPTSPHSSTTTPTAAPRPVPRPRPRLTTKSPDPSSSEAQFAQNLPPTADEVEEHVNEMVRSKLALEEAEERRKQEAEKQNEWSTVQSSSRADLSSDHQDGGSCKFVNNKDVDASGGRGFYENSDIVQSSLRRSAESQMKQETQGSDLGHGQGWLEAAFGEPDSSGGEYAQVQKRTRGVPSAASEFETNFDPFVTIPTNQPGLPPVPVPGGSMLQPTKMWDNPGYACGAGQEAPDSVQSSGPSDSQRNSSEYEAVWFSERQKEDRPGMVRPHSQLMTFTPKPVEDRSAVQVCEPAYGERLGEYIGLDPTYNIPPPSLPPPPLPPQAVVSSRPPSIPPRPVHRNSPKPRDSFLTLQDSSSLLGESSTEAQTHPSSREPSTTVFEALPTPGFNAPFEDDDPFKYSGFDSECQVFNKPLSTTDLTEGVGVADSGESVYEVGDTSEGFVVEWPKLTELEDGTDNTYQEIEAAEATAGRSESFRLSQVPPPPPRLRRGPDTAVPAAAAAATPVRNTPSPQPSMYSLAQAQADDHELSRSVDSSDSSEDLYHERASSTGPLSIITPTQPRKNERYGYLYKQGGVRANRGWRMRWVVFNGKDLRYYDNNRSQISKKIIPLSSMKEVISDVREGDTNRFKFRLVTTLRDRTFLFAADTRDDCCTWTNTLMAAILENKADGANGEEEVSKPDKEGFIRFENNNKKFYVAIWGKTLCYYDSFEDFQMHCPVHEIDMKLSSVKDRKKNKLQLSTHYAHFSLVFDSHQEAQSWRMAIEDAIAEGLADDSQGTQFGSLSVLEKVYENDSNRICADCEDENPHWASINLGVVLCKKCAGIHRMFDSSISKIRSLRMDTRVWTPSLIELMKAVGNGNANLFWEHDLLPIQKIARDSLPEQRKTFAQLKYQSKRYSNQHPLAHDKRKLNEALLQVSSTNDLLEAMKIIFSGADLSFSGGPERENAYQTAKRHGQRLLMELLYQNGGDCSSLDEGSISDEGRLREDVRLQGYLMKTGPAGRTFDQRWCVLEHGALTYYINDKSTTAKDSIDRKTILCLQEISSEKQENAFEISTSKSGNRVYTFAAESLSERGMWMRTLGKLISPVAVMEHVGMMDFSLAALVFMRESVSEDWRQAWIMLSWRLLYFMDKDLKLDHVDLRKATQIKYCQTGACPMCMEKGRCFVLSAPGQTFYIQANLERDTSRILETVSVSMKQSGKSLLDQQLTADSVPVIVDKCLTQVLSRGQKEVGIYRKAATHSRVMSLIEELKKDAHAVRLDDFDIHEVANALKRFLRELEDSLFMRERYNEWIRTSLIDDDHNKFLWYRYLLEKLPLVNYNTLRRVVLHIWKMAQYEAQSKMNAQSFCTCFAPTLMRTESDPVQGNNPGHEIKVLMDLVFQRDYLFKIEQKELDHEAKIQAATQKIIAAQQDSQPSSTFLMPVSMYSHNGQCEMVNVTPATSAQDVVDYLTRKCNLSGRTFALTEVLFKGALERPLFPSSNVLLTTGRWGDWDEAFRKEMCLCLTDTETLDKLDANYDNSRPLFGEVRYADSKSKTKFKKATVEFKQYVLTFYKDARARSQLCSWKVEELTIYLGIDSKRSPPNNFGFTFTVNNKEEKSRNSCFGHCVSLPSEEEMYRWVSALLVAQNPDGLRVWNK